MNRHDRESNEPTEELDRLLSRAHWPEPTPESTRRLEQFYVTRRRKWPIRIVRAAVAAAAAVALAWMLFPSKAPVAPLAGNLPHRRDSTPAATVEWPDLSASRPPTELESLLLSALEHRQSATVASSSAANRAPSGSNFGSAEDTVPVVVDAANPADSGTLAAGSAEAVAAFLDWVERSPDAALAALAALDDAPLPVEAFFLTLGDARFSRRTAAARVLGHINGPEVTHRLAQLVDQDIHRREALIALAWSRGTEAQAYLAAATTSPQIGALVRSILLQRDLQKENRI